MPHHFDTKSFEQLLGDAETLRSLASDLDTRLAPLADTLLRRLIEPAVDAAFQQRPIVLVVDDSQEAREATAILLEQAGFRAVTAGNGVEALIVAHYARPVVVLLDLMMPILDGLQTARLLSESPTTRQMRVIAYSGRVDMFSRRLPGTFTAILSKPTTPEELLSLIHRQTGVLGGDSPPA